MNKTCFIIIGMLFLTNAFAQHSVGLIFDGTTAWQLDNVESTTPQLGGCIGVGAIYQYQNGRFLLNTGIGFSSAYLPQNVDTQHIDVPMRDTEGMNFIYRGELYNRQDQIVTTDISIPIMLGIKTSFGLYALGGARVNFSLHAWSFQDALLTTKGDYGNRYHEMLENLPQHGYFTALPVKNAGVIKIPIDLRVCAELGYEFSPIRIGAFVEYGVLNGLLEGTNQLTEVDCSQYMQVSMNHIYTTLSPKINAMHQLSAGIRMTLLWSIDKNNIFRKSETFGDRERGTYRSSKK